MSKASSTAKINQQKVWNVGNVYERTKAAYVPFSSEAASLFFKEMSITTLSKITELWKSFEYNLFLHSRNWFILAEDNWNFEDIVLKENEIFVHRPYFPAIAVGNSLNIQDEQGFKYRKIRASKRVDRWECIKKNKGCPCSIKTRGETIILQRNEHNHTIEDYRKLKKFWIQLLSLFLNFIYSCRRQLE